MIFMKSQQFVYELKFAFLEHIFTVYPLYPAKKNIFVITYLPLFSAFPKSTKKHLIFIV